MPRVRKTLSGAKAQPVAPVAGQTYGAGVEQMQLQQAMPAPQTAAPMPAGGPVAPPTGTPPQPPIDFGAVLASAQQLQGQTGLLTQPTLRPNEPITAGLQRGPGAGPEALAGRVGTPAGDLLRLLTRETGDSAYSMLADRARA